MNLKSLIQKVVVFSIVVFFKTDYNTQDYWVFWTLPSSGILETRKHDVLETGSVSVLR
jgi:hypothetical protein